MEKLADRELFVLIAQGNQAAFAIIYRNYSGLLHNYSLKILKSASWAEEVVQDVFLNLWVHRESLLDIDNPAGFLRRITINRSVDWIRKNELEVRSRYLSKLADAVFVQSPLQYLDFKQSEHLYKTAVENLPPQRKSIYQLKNEAGLSYDEIASRLNISKHTVRNHIAKATATIRSYLIDNKAFILCLAVCIH